MKFIDSIYNKFMFRYYHVAIGENFRCDGRLIIQGHGEYSIGKNVHIISKETVNPIGGGRTVLQTLEDGKITIGDNVGMSHCIICSREEITIEDNALLGGGVKIYDNDFHSIDLSLRMKSPDLDIKRGAVRIMEGAFIGAHSIILKGVTIGRRSVVGAGSVVTRDIPDCEIWAGNPAYKIGIVK